MFVELAALCEPPEGIVQLIYEQGRPRSASRIVTHSHIMNIKRHELGISLITRSVRFKTIE